MARLFGNASIKWDSDAEEHVLRVPLQRVRPARGSRVYNEWSIDRTVKETITIGSGVYDRIVTIRYEDDISSLLSMLKAGIEDNEELTYYPDVSDTGTKDVFKIVEPQTVDDIDEEEDFGVYEEVSITLRIRKTDGNDFSTI